MGGNASFYKKLAVFLPFYFNFAHIFCFLRKKKPALKGDVHSGEFEIAQNANARIAFDWSNALWAKPKPL